MFVEPLLGGSDAGGATPEYWRVAMVVPDDEIDPESQGVQPRAGYVAVRYFDTLELYVQQSLCTHAFEFSLSLSFALYGLHAILFCQPRRPLFVLS